MFSESYKVKMIQFIRILIMWKISLANRDMSLNHRSNLNRENFWHIDQSEQLM